MNILTTLELSCNSNEFGRVLLVKLFTFGKLEVHMLEVVWRFEPITFYIGELRVKLILATSHLGCTKAHICSLFFIVHTRHLFGELEFI